MKKLLACLAVGAAALAAAPQSSAQLSAEHAVEAGCRTPPAAASIAAKIFQRSEDSSPGLFRDTALASDREAQDLRRWWDDNASCRQSRVNAVAKNSSAAASLRRTMDLRAEKVLNDLIARRISYGAANRQWSQDEFDFNRLYANVLQQRTLPLEPLQAPPLNQIVSPEERARQAAEDYATGQRLMDDAAKARQDAVRPALCPSNPSGLPGPASDPVAQPFC